MSSSKNPWERSSRQTTDSAEQDRSGEPDAKAFPSEAGQSPYGRRDPRADHKPYDRRDQPPRDGSRSAPRDDRPPRSADGERSSRPYERKERTPAHGDRFDKRSEGRSEGRGEWRNKGRDDQSRSSERKPYDKSSGKSAYEQREGRPARADDRRDFRSNERSSARGERTDRGYGRNDRSGDRSFSRNERGSERGSERSGDRGDRNFSRNDRGSERGSERSGERGDRSFSRNERGPDRGTARGERSFSREERPRSGFGGRDGARPRDDYKPRTEGAANPWKEKAAGLHPQNPHQGRYDMDALVQAVPELAGFLAPNPRGEQTIDFSDKQAVVCLNRALLKHVYGVEHWHLPDGFLCPPIPGRMDYLCHLKDLPRQKESDAPLRVLDIGTGANLIYPILGSRAFGWQFVATDCDAAAIRNAHKLVTENPTLAGIDIRMQRKPDLLFTGIIKAGDYFDLMLCNPPFFGSQKEAEGQAIRKWRNLKGEHKSTNRNFGGQSNELWCEGGELAFVKRMMRESKEFGAQVGWFTSLVSRDENLPDLKRVLRQLEAADVRIVPMAQGQKNSRFIAWRF
ncbi:23S rRNA (adenine(1618)-N(6))-methyltransferase RlmF [Thalassolituus sp. LLYu03]|uniref:23S rRNA (adenine(1618)-N(6))-methyltransferase RlmF n=1 Tax=Thalassolituus sp. LLYu03 TaxID=3421656 RepID=UPI003D2AF3A9